MHRLIEIAECFTHPKIALVGDYMLDRYVHGDTDRISPEAPVLVFRVLRRESHPGGAGSVAMNILALGGRVNCIGVVGQDRVGDELMGMLSSSGAETATLTRLPGRPTTLKQRLVGLAQHRHRQQILRMDEESSDPLQKSVSATLRASLRSTLTDCQAVAIEDYDKGVFTDSTTPQLISDARSASVPVVVDPARISDYRRYRGATMLTPNRYEAALASGVEISDADSLERAARQIIQTTGAEAVMITLDKEGAYLARSDGESRTVPTRPRAVYDVAGAGDAVLAMLAVALAGGCEAEDAVALANVAGGLEVERFGVVPVSRDEVLDELHSMLGLRGGKVVSQKRLAREIVRRRRSGQTIVFTNGCFDLLHAGHVRYLRQARELGACLIVAINSDDSVRRLKGQDRPVIGQDERAEMLGALECVDYVTIFEEDTPEPLLEQIKPDILAKGGTTPVVVGAEIVEAYGGKVLTLDMVEGASTTEIINRIVNSGEQ
ncbi:MAG: D-glycero-beta-D-manno-heptose 1-phosphate adenylyltransferase [Phycisphaerae bacterium]|nr:D-glycero-beta-D-manno-heptose 1-phosphate adenylyltransferase [Phycisphaerae bacterium]